MVKAYGHAGGALLAWAPRHHENERSAANMAAVARVGRPAMGQDPMHGVCDHSVRNGCSAGTANDAAVTVGLQQDRDQSAARSPAEPLRKRWTRLRARAVALLALILMAMPAVGDVIWPDIDVIGRNDFFDYRHHRPTDYIYRDDTRIDEVFPIKHRCSEVRVLIHAQRRTMERMIESCKALKWADDRFHALMQTSPGDALAKSNVYGTVTTLMEMFVLDRGDPEFVNYLMEFWNSDRSGFYIGGVAVVSEREEDTEMPRWRYLRGHHLSIEVHEYVHHLQFDFGWLGAPLPIWDEGGATFIQFEYVRSVLRNDWYATGWDFSVDGWEVVEERVVPRGLRNGLPQLTTFFDEHGDQWEDLLNEFNSVGGNILLGGMDCPIPTREASRRAIVSEGSVRG